jgi:hypothetical protein
MLTVVQTHNVYYYIATEWKGGQPYGMYNGVALEISYRRGFTLGLFWLRNCKAHGVVKSTNRSS